MVNVKGRWALITGASRGIGYLSALYMADLGCNLVLHSRDAAHCKHVLDEVRAKGVEAYAVSAELSDMNSVKAMLDEIALPAASILSRSRQATLQARRLWTR